MKFLIYRYETFVTRRNMFNHFILSYIILTKTNFEKVQRNGTFKCPSH